MPKVPLATANCFVYLEPGILPIDHEIYKRQREFLHHMLNLNDKDHIKIMYLLMRSLPDQRNWANHLYNIHASYGISLD